MSDETADAVTCYRHPRREAPLRCTRCERPICLDDAIDAPVGFLCPECARQPANVRRATAAVARAGGQVATRTLLGIIVVVFLLQQVSPVVFQQGALFGPAVEAGEWWRVVTGGFLHSPRNLLHVAFNGYLLYLLGQMLEPSTGTNRFVALFAAGLFGGSLGALLLNWGGATIGASGAVFGLMGAAMVGLRRRGIDPWRSSIGMLVLINLGFTFLVPGISIGGHIGGLLGGALAAVPLFALEHERRSLGTGLAWVVAGILAVAAIVAGVAGPVF